MNWIKENKTFVEWLKYLVPKHINNAKKHKRYIELGGQGVYMQNDKSYSKLIEMHVKSQIEREEKEGKFNN